MTYSAAVSTPSRSVSTETPSQVVSSLLHLVTQWMSLVTVSVGRARNCPQGHCLGSSTSLVLETVHRQSALRAQPAACPRVAIHRRRALCLDHVLPQPARPAIRAVGSAFATAVEPLPPLVVVGEVPAREIVGAATCARLPLVAPGEYPAVRP